MGLIFFLLMLNGLVGANPDGALAQAILKQGIGYEHAWAWRDGGIVTSWSMPSMSMAPTLITADRVLGIKHGRPPQSGDIWVFQHPHSDRRMVKRIVGLPGETVQMKDGLLLINGRAVGRTLIRSVTYLDDGIMTHANEYAEQLPGEAHPHLIHEFSDADSLDETPIFEVPAGYVFAMGDNSEDSRAPSGHRALAERYPQFWPYRQARLPSDPRDDAIGFVPIENLLGRVATVYLSFHRCERGGTRVTCLRPKIGERL